MRGDLALTARLLLRRTGAAASVAMLAGLAVVAAALLPWWVVTSRITTLGRSDGHVVADLHGLPGTLPGWIAVVLGMGAVALAGGLAVDRPVRRARAWLAADSGALVAVGVASLVAVPDLDRVAGESAGMLRASASVLPTGVEMSLTVGPGPGPWVVTGAAVAMGLAALLAREHA